MGPNIISVALLVVLIAVDIWMDARTIRAYKAALAENATLVRYIGQMGARGVYVISCKANGATYVGSTKTNFMARWGQHIKELDRGVHGNARMQEDWNLYGREQFTFNVLELRGDDDEIVELERVVLEDRARNLPPIKNYNVAFSRVYPVPAPAETEDRPAIPRPRLRRAMSRRVPRTPGEPITLEDLGLTPEEIEALGGTE